MRPGAAEFAQQLAAGNVIFRIPTPTFGLGLVEATPDSTLQANLAANRGIKSQLGISGSSQYQRQRRHRHSLWLESTEQIADGLRR